MQADIGLIGLGVMGANLALNIAEKGFPIAVTNRTPSVTDAFMANAGPLASRLRPCRTLADLVAEMKPPRAIIIMVKAGSPVDEQIAALRPLLTKGDIIIDAGNANFRDTIRRTDALKGSGIDFIGMGVSGGEDGARHGPSIMVGGPEASYARISDVLTAISAKHKGEPCSAWMGPDGAGHFVKMIHNGIEYADMQMIAEVYGLLRDVAGLSAAEMAAQFERWNEGPLNSYLIEITAKVLSTIDAKTGKPIVDVIEDQAGQKGTGRWSVMEAQDLGAIATTMEAAVAARLVSALKAKRVKAAAVYPPAATAPAGKSAPWIGELEKALLASKIAAYSQGFGVLQQASDAFGWKLPLATVARIWRAGCIIRSQFLDRMASAIEASGGNADLFMAPDFIGVMRENHGALRQVAAIAAGAASPAPALFSALAYFDGYRQARGTANLIQGQRDFFGAHGFARIGETGEHHGTWPEGGAKG